jgi:hypothetical protein
VGLGTTISVENFTLKDDAGHFLLKQGAVTFLAPVDNEVTGAIFLGEGHFSLKPFTQIDSRELIRRTKSEAVEQDFSEVIFRFSGGIHRSLLQGAKAQMATPAAAANVFRNWQEKVRQRHEIPLSFSDNLLNGDEMDNIDAELLAQIYNPARPPFFEAFIGGVRHRDLRFFFKGRGGALTAIDSPEEVALVNYDPDGMEDGIWYLSHKLSEYQEGSVSSSEDKCFVSGRKYSIETAIGNNDHLTSVARIEFGTVLPGERVVRFQLLPNLRVSRVADGAGKDLYFVQESRRADGSFYVILPQGTRAGETHTMTVEYAGDKVLIDAGNGSFYVRAREAWYPALNSFSEHSLYDLTFRVPKKTGSSALARSSMRA